jgi:hypothetical protein
MTPDKTELRGLAPTHLAQALDAIAMLRGLDRNTYVVQVLEAEVKRVAHEASFLSRVLRGNTYLPDADGGRKE